MLTLILIAILVVFAIAVVLALALPKTTTPTGLTLSPDTPDTALSPAAPKRNPFRLLRGPQVLLIFGVFLVVVSASVLVAFNWASFSPLLQFGLLAGVCGGLWGLGTWLSRKGTRAGLGLQVAGGLLVPIVAFALTRPGLLDLLPRQSWLLTAGLSMVVYGLAAWRLRQPIFMIAACISLANTVLASMGLLAQQWMPASLIFTLCGFSLVAHLLRQSEPELSHGPRWIAHVAAPITVLVISLWHWLRPAQTDLITVAVTFWASCAFYVLALLLERKQRWAWPAAWLPLMALFVTLAAFDVKDYWWSVAPACLTLLYVSGAVAVDAKARKRILPVYLTAAKAALAALIRALGSQLLLSWALPIVLLAILIVMVGYHLGRFTWLGEKRRAIVPALAAAIALPLLFAWVVNFAQAIDLSRLLLAFTVLALLTATWLRRTRLSYWTVPGLAWGTLGTSVLTMFVLISGGPIPVLPQSSPLLIPMSQFDPVDGIGLLLLAATAIYLSLRWQQFWLGFVAVALAWLGLNRAAVLWPVDGHLPTLADMGLLWCGMALGCVGAAYALRAMRTTNANRYALPYLLASLVLPALAVPTMQGDGLRVAGTWWMLTGLGLVQARYFRQRWILIGALLAADMAVLNTSALLWPGATPGGGGLILLGMTALQVSVGWLLRRKRDQSKLEWMAWIEPYIAAALSAVFALTLAAESWAMLSVVACGLAALSVLLAFAEGSEVGIWAALALFTLGLSSWHASQDWIWIESAGMHIWLLVGLMVIGALLKQKQTERPLLWGALSLASLWWLIAVAFGIVYGQLGELAFACVGYGLVLGVLALRRRSVMLALIAPTLWVAALWCYTQAQGWHDPQWFFAPIGLYLLLIAAVLRLYKPMADKLNMADAAKALEWVACFLLLGVTAAQMIAATREHSQIYSAVLCGESLLLAGYGTARQLRVPFMGGSAAFIGSVLWLGLDPLLALNKWVLFGGLGLLMIAAYVVLEHGRPQLRAVSQRLVTRVKRWQ